jgi:hypothetical protein
VTTLFKTVSSYGDDGGAIQIEERL